MSTRKKQMRSLPEVDLDALEGASGGCQNLSSLFGQFGGNGNCSAVFGGGGGRGGYVDGGLGGTTTTDSYGGNVEGDVWGNVFGGGGFGGGGFGGGGFGGGGCR